MDRPGQIDIHADRWVPFLDTLIFVDFNLASAATAAQVRLKPDTAGSPLATMTTAVAYAGSATVSAHILAGRLQEVPPDHALTDTVYVSRITLSISEATMEGMPYPAELGDDMVLAWDIHITPSGGTKDVWARGKFIVRAGATQ